MTAQLLDGKALAQKIKDQLRQEVADLKDSTGSVPNLRNIIIGKDPSSCAYANSQKKVAEYIGIDYELVNLPLDISQDKLIEYVHQQNDDKGVHGIMLHKPLPDQINGAEVANCISISKDLEGINVTNIGKMLLGQTNLTPCTPAAVVEHIKSTGIDLRGKEAVIVGHSDIVGKPLSLLLLRDYATVTVCHVATSEADRLVDHISRADILVVAVGKASLVKGSWIKEGAIVVDVGINQVDGKIVGDVEFETAKERASYITPVPGGVGPVTVTMLMKNGIEAYRLQTEQAKAVK